MKNIVLIGLPGSGKSSLGRRLARRLERPFLDTDQLVETAAGKSVSRIFAEEGEQWFRECETRCVREAAALSGAVIATGGGVVLRKENMEALQENGVVIFIDRRPERILKTTDLTDRPLVRDSGDKLRRLHRERLPLYRGYARRVVRNDRRLKQLLLRTLKACSKEEDVL